MSWSIFTVQAVIFAHPTMKANESFEIAFQHAPSNFHMMQAPGPVSVATSEASGRALVAQVGADRLDFFAVPVQQGPRVFVPLPQPDDCQSTIEAAVVRVSERVPNIVRLSWVIKLIHPAQDDIEATSTFAKFSGIAPGLLGSRDHFFQTSNPDEMPNLPSAKLNQVVQWRTETVRSISMHAVGGNPSALAGRDDVAVTLSVDMNVIFDTQGLPAGRVSEMIGALRERARAISTSRAHLGGNS